MFVPIVLELLGLLLIYLEFFVPGGIMAIIGAVLLICSVVIFAVQNPGWLGVLLYFVGMAVLVFCVCKLALRRIKSAKPERSVYLDKDQEGYVAASFDKNLIGKKAICLSDLKPSGHIIVDGLSHQAVSESGYISKGSEVLVIRGEGGHLVVKLRT